MQPYVEYLYKFLFIILAERNQDADCVAKIGHFLKDNIIEQGKLFLPWDAFLDLYCDLTSNFSCLLNIFWECDVERLTF